MADGDSKKKPDGEKQGDEKPEENTFSSMAADTSEDEDAKRKEALKNAKKAKKGLTAAEMEATVDVNLKETKTITLVIIRGTVLNQDSEEQIQATADNKEYDQLKQNKIGSDSFMHRGSQTLNLTQKHKGLNFQGFT